MTADQRVTSAREFLAGARRRKVTDLPPSLLERECAELRRLLGQMLDVVDEATTLTPADLRTVRDALDVAADTKRDSAANCPDCPHTEGGLCTTCDSRLTRADEYDNLAARLGGTR